jgi:hypothetical protein
MKHRLGFKEAYDLVKEARPSIHPNPGFRDQLKSLCALTDTK